MDKVDELAKEIEAAKSEKAREHLSGREGQASRMIRERNESRLFGRSAGRYVAFASPHPTNRQTDKSWRRSSAPIRREGLERLERRRFVSLPTASTANFANHPARIASCEPQTRRRRKAKPKRAKRDRYDVSSYRRAVKYGIQQANKNRESDDLIPNWFPLQLRHTRATKIRQEFGIEAAQVVLGHARADVMQVYAERNLAAAIEVHAKVANSRLGISNLGGEQLRWKK